LLLALSIPLWLNNAFWLHLLILGGIFIILVCGLDLLTGYAGIPSLTQAGLWAIGAYTSALLAMRWDWAFPATLIGALVITLFAAWLIGLLGLRLRQRWTSFTFIIGVVLTLLLESLTLLTGGAHGLVGVPAFEASLPGLEQIKLNPFRDKAGYFYLVLAFVALTLWLKQRIVHSRMGMALVAVREDEDLARSVGVKADRYKLSAFLISAAFAALAGSLYAHYVGYLHPHLFTFTQSFNLLVMNMVGGTATMLGTVLGPLAVLLFGELTHPLHATLAEMVFSLLLLLVLLYLPNGIAGLIYQIRISPNSAMKFLRTRKEVG
jgi:branched-chain amino acid transport system permease protein